MKASSCCAWCAAGVVPTYQQLIDAYAAHDPQRGKTLLSTLIDLLLRSA